MTGFVVGEIKDPRRSLERRDHAARNVIDMDATEDLVGVVDPVRPPLGNAVEDRTTGTVDTGEAKEWTIRLTDPEAQESKEK